MILNIDGIRKKYYIINLDIIDVLTKEHSFNDEYITIYSSFLYKYDNSTLIKIFTHNFSLFSLNEESDEKFSLSNILKKDRVHTKLLNCNFSSFTIDFAQSLIHYTQQLNFILLTIDINSFNSLNSFSNLQDVDDFFTKVNFYRVETTDTVDGIFEVLYMRNDFISSRKDACGSIGNVLVSYFSGIGVASLQHTSFDISNIDSNFSEIPILRTLPRVLDQIELLDQKMKHVSYEGAISSSPTFAKYPYISCWEIHSVERIKFWLALKPLANFLLHNMFLLNNIQPIVRHPVIHFRCGDVPFLRHGLYKFAKYSFYLDALNEFKENGIDTSKVYLMFSNGHGTDWRLKEKSTEYATDLKRCLNEHGYPVEIISNSNIEDLSIMFYAPGVISSCGSFSFIGGLFGVGKFIMNDHSDFPGMKDLPSEYNFIKQGYTINHSEIADYYDTSTVIRRLRD